MLSTDKRAWLLLGAFSLLLFLITASTFSSLGVVLPAMVQEQGWSWGQAGLGFTFLGAACGASSYFPAILIRRLGVRATLLAGTGVMAAGFLALARTDSLAVYFAGAALCGIGYQMMALIPGTHVLAACFKRRGLALGIYFTCGSLGGVAGPWMVLAVMKAADDQWRAYWLVQLVLGVVVGVACALITGGRGWLADIGSRADPEPDEKAPRWRSPVNWTVRAAVRTPQFYILGAAYFAHLLIGATVASLSIAHLTQRGVDAATAGAMLSFESLMATGARLLGGVIGDYLDPRYLLLLSIACLAAGSMALSVADNTVTMLLYAAGTGIGYGLTALAVTLVLLNYYGRAHNLELFSMVCLVGALSALGPFISGAMRDHLGGFGQSFQLYGAICALILVAALFMRRPDPAKAGAGAPSPTLVSDLA